jgi:hypothetical protein
MQNTKDQKMIKYSYIYITLIFLFLNIIINKFNHSIIMNKERINEIKAFVDQFNADINEAYETFYQKVHILSIFLFIEQRHSFTTFITKQIFT